MENCLANPSPYCCVVCNRTDMLPMMFEHTDLCNTSALCAQILSHSESLALCVMCVCVCSAHVHRLLFLTTFSTAEVSAASLYLRRFLSLFSSLPPSLSLSLGFPASITFHCKPMIVIFRVTLHGYT